MTSVDPTTSECAASCGQVSATPAEPTPSGLVARQHSLPSYIARLDRVWLALAALRVDLIRVRYGLSTALAAERGLLEERRTELARVGTLRDPARLGRLAREGGFGPPERVIELPPVSEGAP